MTRQIRFGTGKGQVFPHQEAQTLMSRGRRLVQPPWLIARRLSIEPGNSVLELGCGPGYFSRAVAKRIKGGRYVLFDIQPEMLTMAVERTQGDGAPPHPVQGDALALPFRDDAFDIVFLVAVLGETGDPGACIAEIRRVLRTGGRLSISEIRGDDDFMPRRGLRAMAADGGFVRERGFGLGWNYTENFTSVDTAPKS